MGGLKARFKVWPGSNQNARFGKTAETSRKARGIKAVSTFSRMIYAYIWSVINSFVVHCVCKGISNSMKGSQQGSRI